MNTPIASRERINPMVNDPMSRVILCRPLLQWIRPRYRSYPARATREFALSGATDFPRVIDQVCDALQALSFEQRRHGHLQIERSLFQRPVREGGCMKVSRSEEHTSELQSHSFISY